MKRFLDESWVMEARSEIDLKISPRAGCFIASAMGIILLSLIWSVFLLAIQGEIRLQTGDLTGLRLWLITADGGTGLGLSRTRNASAEQDENEEHCVETTTHFLLLGSSAPEPVGTYCECYANQGGGWQFVGACEP
jgi:hypothetical protein